MSSTTEKSGNRALKGDFSHIVQKLSLCNSYQSVIKLGMLNVIPTEQQKKKTTKYTQKEMRKISYLTTKSELDKKDYNEGNEKQKQKESNKMAQVNPVLSIINLKVNGLNSQTK